MGGRTWAVVAVLVVIGVAALNLSSRSQGSALSLRVAGEAGGGSALSDEVKELRAKVAKMEALLDARAEARAAAAGGAGGAGGAAASPAAGPTMGNLRVAPSTPLLDGEERVPSTSRAPTAGYKLIKRRDSGEKPPPAAATQPPLVESSGAAAPTPAAVTPEAMAANAASAAQQAALPERRAEPAPKGAVPHASWWSDREVQVAGGAWCRKPPPYAAPKPALPMVSPGKDLPELTTELAKKHASKDNMLIATYVNYNRLDFAYTLVKHLLAMGNPHFLVGALDEKALRGLQSHGIPSFIINSGLTTNDYGWGTKAFRQLGLHKVQLVLNLAKTGVDCLTVDADAFLLRDPLPYIRALSADVLMSSDHLVATNGYDDPGLEGTAGFYSAYNIGYIFIKANALEFVQKWRDTCFNRPNDWDQVLFGQVLSQGQAGREVDKRRLRKMFKRSDGTHVMAGVLPVSLFASGHTFFVSRMAHLMHTQPYMVHTTFQYGGAQGKRHRLREAMIWEDEPAYFDGRFLTYEPSVPLELVYPHGGKVSADGTQDFAKRGSVEQHFALVHHQLTQIRNAFALARKLDRTLILPKLICGLDRWWAPHSGIIPGSAARLPLLECPADHVIDLERMGRPEKHLREAGLLCNPRTPSRILNSRAQAAASLSSEVQRDGSNAAELRSEGSALVSRLRSEHGAKRVLELSTVAPDYRALFSEGEARGFEQEVKSWAGLWCCNRPPGGRGAGHIWYDFFWDVKPHRDRHNRLWDGEWKVKMGP